MNDPRAKLRRSTSQLFMEGGDPYNTADTIRVHEELLADFIAWVEAGNVPSLLHGKVVQELDAQVAQCSLLRKQAE